MWWSKRAESGKRDGRDDFWFTDVGMGTAAGASVNHDSVLRLPAVAACVSVVSEALAQLPIGMFERQANGDKERRQNHPLDSLIRERPNDEHTSIEFREMMTAWAMLHGTAYAEIVPGARGAVDQLIPIAPKDIEATTETDLQGRRQLRWKVKQSGMAARMLLRGDLFIVRRHVADNGVTGVDTVSQHKETFGHALAVHDYGARFFGNDATPRTIFKHPGFFKDKESRDNFLGAIKRALLGTRRHSPILLEHAIDVERLGMTNEEAQFLETKKLLDLSIAQLFNVQPHKIGILDRATFCLPANTDVLTSTGPVAVEEIEAGQDVWSLSADDQWVLSKVKRVICTGEDEILQINTGNRTLRCNSRHRVLVRRKYPNPQPGQGGYQGIAWKNEFVPAGDLEVGDTVVSMHGIPDLGSENCPTRRVSSGFMEFCGLLLGDGSVYPNWGVSIARAETALYMDHYRDVIRSEFRKYDGGNGRGDQTVVALAPVFLQESDRQTKFASVLAARELKKIGLSGNARTKTVPGWVFRLKEEHRLSFVRGYLDADGSVDKKGRMSFSSCNRRMLSQIRHLCMMSAIPVTNLRCQKGETNLPNGKRVKFEQWSFTCSDPGVNRKIGSHDPRYIERLQQGQPFGRKGRNYPWHGGRDFDTPGCVLGRIASIEHQPAEPVYDLEVADTHNFVADGVVVHNSNIEEQSLEFVVYTAMPWIVRWEQALKRDLLSAAEPMIFPQHNVAGLLRGDLESRYRAYSVGRNWGWLSVNDVRRLESMNSLDDGDEYLRPLNMTPAGDPAEPAQQSANRPRGHHMNGRGLWEPNTSTRE